MSFFDQSPRQKNKPKKEPLSKEQIQQKESSRRNRRKKNAQNIKQQKFKRVYPPLMIRAKPNQDQIEQPLDDYVSQLYAFKSQEKDKKFIERFLQEDDDGPIQYKLKLINPSDDRLDHLATQMKFRIREGQGEAHYRIGVQDNGRPMGLDFQEMLDSLKTICLLAGKVGADVMVFRVTEGIKGLVIQLIIKLRYRQGVKFQIRVLLIGEPGSGKSTLLGVLKSGQKDNGKGYARGKVLTHKHEFMTGTTQSRSHHVVGFDVKGRLYNHESMMSIDKWLDNSNKVLTFIDVGGHQKAQKQFVSSLCSFFPQYALWVVSGIGKTPFKSDTLELASIFGLPLIVVITHYDLMNKQQEIEALLRIKQQLKKFCPDKTPCLVRQMQHAVLFSRITSSEDVIPIFFVSSVSGKNLQIFTNFLNLLPSANELKNNLQLSTEFSISDKYTIDSQHIIAGTVIKGSIKRGQILHLGPDLKGSFRAVEIKSIECLRVPVKLAMCGQICTVAIRPLNYAKEWLQKQPNAIRRGMVLIDGKSNPKAVYQFLVELAPYSNSRQQFSISEKYQPVINTLTTRQICSIVTLKTQKEIFIPEQMMKKKSRSIDSRKIQHQHVQHNHHTQSIDTKFKKPFKKPFKIPSKKSVDLTSSDLAQENLSTALQPIAEQTTTAKKTKQIISIYFSCLKPTNLRLRFKYYPQYITVGQRVVINQLKVIGKVKQIYY